MNQVANLVKSRGHWIVRIRPIDYNNERVPRLSDLEDAVRRSAVELRGWDFPHYEHRTRPLRTDEYIEQELRWEHYVELWRAYRSGQFISVSALWGDWRDNSSLWPAPTGWKAGSTLGVEDTVFRFVEIYEFASRWAQAASFGKSTVIDCILRRLKGRKLELGARRIGFMYPRTAAQDEWRFSKEYATALLFSAPRDLAIPPAIQLFELFGWDVNENIVRSIQAELRR